MRLEAGVFGAAHHRTQKHGFEFAAVIGEMTMRLAEDRDDLRHLEAERTVLVGQRGAMALRLMLLHFVRVRPDPDAFAGERRDVPRLALRAGHSEQDRY